MDSNRVADEAGLTRYLDGLRAAARRLTPSPEEVEDLVQDSLAAAVQGVDRVRNADLLGPWLHQILRRRWYDLLRRRAVERKFRSEGRPAVPAASPDPGGEVVRRALETLDL